MQVLSAAEMQACDRATTERFGIPSLDLMRSASAAVAAFVRGQFPAARRITVLCGRGNNGADGMMAARLLASAGLDVTTILLGSPDELKGDAAIAWQELADSPLGHIRMVDSAADLNDLSALLSTDLILDAVLGTGFKPPMRGLALAALGWINTPGDASRAPILAPILAIDLPSGWPADATTATVDTPVFPADAVITFTAPKPAHLFGQLTRFWHQPVVVAPIGSPDEIVVSSLDIHWAGSSHAVAQTPRPADSNKGKYGHVLVVGGSVGKSGAPAMTSLAAMRSGAGLVTAAVPAPILAQVAAFAPELMAQPLAVTSAGRLSSENLAPDRIAELTKGITVLAIGPGLGQSPEAAEFVTALLSATTVPAVLDADALNILAAKPNLLAGLSRNGERSIVLTPHPGEMARLAGIATSEVQANRLDLARSFARRTGVTLILKGLHTLIAHPGGRVAVNTTGNPGMAKAGSGDMLTGIVAGLLAQYSQNLVHAVEAAVYLHGLAADFAVRNEDEHTLLATDSLPHFSQAFRFRSHRANGYVWLQGLPGDVSHAAAGHEGAE